MSKSELLTILDKSFSKNELKVLCYKLDIDFDNVRGEIKQEKCVHLIEICIRNQIMPKLIELCRFDRPKIVWPDAELIVSAEISSRTPSEHVKISFDKPGILYKPDFLFGRQQLVSQVHHLLDQGESVLLTGLGGIGKTAVATTVVDERLQAGKGPIIWLQPGSEGIRSIFEKIVNWAGTDGEKQSFQSTEDSHTLIILVRNILSRSPATLLVLDDVWQPELVLALREAIRQESGRISMFITSRLKLPIGKSIEVNELLLTESLEMLAFYADDESILSAPGSEELCRLLNGHAFALEIAGTTLKVQHKKPKRLYQKLLQKPHKSFVPATYFIGNRGNISKLLEESLVGLEKKARIAFETFGAFFASGISSHLLADYLDWAIEDAEDALNTLFLQSLVKRQTNTDSPFSKQEATDYYFMHELTYSYATNLFEDGGGSYLKTAERIARYLSKNTQRFDLIYSDQNNIIGAVDFAYRNHADLFVQLVSYLAIGGYPDPVKPSYLDTRGHTLKLLEMVNQAVQLIEEDPSPEKMSVCHHMQTKLGAIHFNSCSLEESLAHYEKAFSIAPDNTRSIISQVLKGWVLYSMEEKEQADLLLLHAYKQSVQKLNPEALSFTLEYRSLIAGLDKKFELQKKLALENILLLRPRKEKRFSLSFALLKLGSAETDLGNYEQARVAYEEALIIAKEFRNMNLTGVIHFAFAQIYHAEGNSEETIRSLDLALKIFEQTGNKDQTARVMSYIAEAGIDSRDL